MPLHPKIAKLIKLGNSRAGIIAARDEARRHLKQFPKDGCATFLSCLQRAADIDVPVILSAQKLADHLEQVRGWERIPVGQQRAGDVGVTADQNGNGLADHIYLCVRPHGPDLMTIADNQAAEPHSRRASGGPAWTKTAYFLRGG